MLHHQIRRTLRMFQLRGSSTTQIYHLGGNGLFEEIVTCEDLVQQKGEHQQNLDSQQISPIYINYNQLVAQSLNKHHAQFRYWPNKVFRLDSSRVDILDIFDNRLERAIMMIDSSRLDVFELYRYRIQAINDLMEVDLYFLDKRSQYHQAIFNLSSQIIKNSEE